MNKKGNYPITISEEDADLLGILLNELHGFISRDVSAKVIPVLTPALTEYSKQNPQFAPDCIKTLGEVSGLLYTLQLHYSTISECSVKFNPMYEPE